MSENKRPNLDVDEIEFPVATTAPLTDEELELLREPEDRDEERGHEREQDHRDEEQQSTGGKHSWAPVDLVKLTADPPEPPAIGGLLYPGKRHTSAASRRRGSRCCCSP